ncbi:hypothetical protein LXL04_033330 [Taraxacum kok-saghyz]
MALSSVCNEVPSFAIYSSFTNPTKNKSFSDLRTPTKFNFAYSDKQTKPMKILKMTNFMNPRTDVVDHPAFYREKIKKIESEKPVANLIGIKEMVNLCGFGYWVQGFRCFPWLALNFHMVNSLHMNPSTLQIVQICAILPMVAKPLYGILSDSIFIGGSHRLPYISIGVMLQVISWGSMAFMPIEALPILMAFILLSNLGASITEVAKDALVVEYGQKNKMKGLQSYAFMALAVGGVLGNCLGGFFLLKTHQPKSMFIIFASLLSLQLAVALKTKEKSLGLPHLSNHNESILFGIKKQFSNLILAIKDESISVTLSWVVGSIMIVPLLSGSLFCYQTQVLNLDPFVIGMSKVIGQLLLLAVTVLYDRRLKTISMRKLIGFVQILYAFSLLLDLVLVKQINLNFGIPNDIFVVCLSGIAEILAQFKILPFQVLFARFAPKGCEGSLMSFLASALCLSSIFSGFLGVGMASILGITSVDYSRLHVGILIQFVAALVPMFWIGVIPTLESLDEKEKKMMSLSKKKRKNRRMRRVVINMVFVYQRKRVSEKL